MKNSIFERYITDVFVETGSFLGDGIQNAIDSGFKNIYSIELSDKYFDLCTDMFKNNTNVKIIKGDSADVLYDVIKDIDCQITFWLDGHHSCGDTALGKYWAPLMQELEQIKKHHIKNHIIMIDDMRCWENFNPVHGFSKEDIFKSLKEINENYTFSYEDGCVEKDILVSKIW